MGQSPDSGSAPASSPASSPSGGSKPTQPMTGSRGYLARLSSQDARVHRRYAVPRLVPLTRACLHRPDFQLAHDVLITLGDGFHPRRLPGQPAATISVAAPD